MNTISKLLLVEYIIIAGYLTVSSVSRLIRITILEHKLRKESKEND